MPNPRPRHRATMSIELLTGLVAVTVPTSLPLGRRVEALGNRSANAAQTSFTFHRDSSVRVTVVGGGMDAAAHTFFTPITAPSLM
jgi:hypothetical protein